MLYFWLHILFGGNFSDGDLPKNTVLGRYSCALQQPMVMLRQQLWSADDKQSQQLMALVLQWRLAASFSSKLSPSPTSNPSSLLRLSREELIREDLSMISAPLPVH